MELLRTGRKAAVLITLTAAIIGAATSASAARKDVREVAVAGNIINIHSGLNNKCLEVRDSNVDNGAYVSMWDCWGGAATQWYWDGEQIRSVLNNKCLEVRDSNVDNGAYVSMWDCWGGAATHWYRDGEQIRSVLNNKCLEVRDSNVDNGAYVSMWSCWGGAATHWYW